MNLDIWGPVIAVAVFLVLSFLAQWGIDSRPGFSDRRTDRNERWFIHSRNE